jgi:hypothetical protein
MYRSLRCDKKSKVIDNAQYVMMQEVHKVDQFE